MSEAGKATEVSAEETTNDLSNEKGSSMGNEDPEKIEAGSSVARQLKNDDAGIRPVDERIQDIKISDLQRAPNFLRYTRPSDALLPTVGHTPNGYFYLTDPAQYQEKALTEGVYVLRCRVLEFDKYSDFALALQTASLHLKPRDGECIYPEKARDFQLLLRLYRKENPNIKSGDHGGDRRSAKAKNEMRFVKIITRELGCSESTVQRLLRHGQYISDQLFEYLISQGVAADKAEEAKGKHPGQRFFGSIQEQKNKLMEEQPEGASEDVISNSVSAAVLRWYDKM